jgi:hypothetical protein
MLREIPSTLPGMAVAYFFLKLYISIQFSLVTMIDVLDKILSNF